MMKEISREAMDALLKSRTRSLLTMLGIVWGIAAVTLLIAYGSGFRAVLVTAFNSFGKTTVIAWPQQTSQQAGGQRAGKTGDLRAGRSRLHQGYRARPQNHLPGKLAASCPSYSEQLVNAAIRAVCAEYGEMRNEVAAAGRWISPVDLVERRRVIFLGNTVKRQLFGGRNAIGETVVVGGMRFEVIGVMDKKIQLSNYFTSDDNSTWIPFSTAGDLYNTRNAPVFVFAPLKPSMEEMAKKQLLAALAERQGFSPPMTRP